MVKPGGTGNSSTDVISARLAPLPPRRSLSSMGGRGCLWSKSKTYGIRPPCPGQGEPHGSSGHEKWSPLPIWDGPPQPTFPSGHHWRRAGLNSAWRSVARADVGGFRLAPETLAHLALEDLLG